MPCLVCPTTLPDQKVALLSVCINLEFKFHAFADDIVSLAEIQLYKYERGEIIEQTRKMLDTIYAQCFQKLYFLGLYSLTTHGYTTEAKMTFPSHYVDQPAFFFINNLVVKE